MKHIREAAREVPVLAKTEVLVLGGGPAGLAAALAAARQGAETLLVERCGCFGGNITQSGVESLAWYRHPQTVESDGIGREFERRAVAMGGTAKEPQSESQALNPELFKCVADQLLLESEVSPLLHCFGVEPVMDGPTIQGIVTESKSGRQAILAKRVIDASGDADIAFRAGAPSRMAPKKDLMGVTVTFSCSGVDRARFLDYQRSHPARLQDWSEQTSGKEDHLFSPYLAEPFQKAKQAGEIPKDLDIAGTWSTISEEGEATYLNMVYMRGYDPTEVRDLTRGEMEGRRQALLAVEALKKYTPGFEKARLRSFGAALGTRESRKIIGRSNLTGEDVLNQAGFEDSIGIFPEFLDGSDRVIIPTTGRYFQVPFGILLPRKVDNLLVAGRCVAGDALSHAATRQMMCCALTGQGAGTAAAVSLQEGRTCRDVPIHSVQKALVRQGVRLS
ncbi:MAG: FAD-dependent oxidoreductase [Desulfohalobiaceae bacterium]|nr:FAD-dependent oxidoreductase [Desulfohalobiaceae bacterium]